MMLSPTPEKLNNNLKNLISDRKKFQSDKKVMAKVKSMNTKLYTNASTDKSLKLLKGTERRKTMNFGHLNSKLNESSESLIQGQRHIG